MRPPFDVDLIDRLTPVVLGEGWRVLQTHAYAASAAAHVACLLDAFALRPGALVVDMGSGLGEVARLMHRLRPDLHFVLVNLSPAQLAYSRSALAGGPFLHLCADAHDTLLPAAFADGVMFHSALCQMDEVEALAEAHRLLRPDGRLLLNELVRTSGDGAEMEQVVACRTWSEAQLCRCLENAGFTAVTVQHPAFDLTHFRGLLARKSLERFAEGVQPVLVTAVKKGE